MPIDPEEVFAIVQEGSAGRPHVAQVMVARGYVKTVREAFDKYLGAGKPGARARARSSRRRMPCASSGGRAACPSSRTRASRTGTR